MAQELHTEQILQWLHQPAFWVADGTIRGCNPAADACFFRTGEAVAPLLQTGSLEYGALDRGSLYLTLKHGDQEWDACVQRFSEGDLFLLESTVAPELRAMSLASMKMREPLAALMAELDPLMEELPDEARAGRINRRLHQMLRILGNMSAGIATDASHMELRDICGILDELFEKTAVMAEAMDLRLEWTVPGGRVFTLVDTDSLERAVYNMLSNAIKATGAGGKITAHVQQKDDRLHICITDGGRGICPEEIGSVYTRYLRAPGIEAADKGIGLGMHVIAAAARLHGGTVLLETPSEGGTRVTMTLPVRSKSGELRSGTVRVDYTGGRDHTLVELSDVLPASFYEY